MAFCEILDFAMMKVEKSNIVVIYNQQAVIDLQSRGLFTQKGGPSKIPLTLDLIILEV
jgi:hypothetical protein